MVTLANMIISSSFINSMNNDKKEDKEQREIILWLDKVSAGILIEILLDACAVDFHTFETCSNISQKDCIKEYAQNIIYIQLISCCNLKNIFQIVRHSSIIKKYGKHVRC